MIFDSAKLGKMKPQPFAYKVEQPNTIIVESEDDDDLQLYSQLKRKPKYREKPRKFRKIIVQESDSEDCSDS